MMIFLVILVLLASPNLYAQSGIGQAEQFQKLQDQQPVDTRYADLFKTLTKSPRDPQAHLKLAQVYLEKDLLELALVSFQRVLKLDSNLAVAHFGLSRTYRKKKIKNLELLEMETAVAKAPQNDRFVYELGVLYMEHATYDYKKAKKTLKALRKLESPLIPKLSQLVEIQ